MTIEEYQKDLDWNKCESNFSNWFPKIADIKELAVPESKVFQLPVEVFADFCKGLDDRNYDYANYRKWFAETALPEIKDFGICFVKNGIFSNKFDFGYKPLSPKDVCDKFIDIQNASFLYESQGANELVVRKSVGIFDTEQYETVYHGLPLRTEIRCFYDFDARKLLYSANYWDIDFISEHGTLCKNDKLAFESARERIYTGYAENKQRVETAVTEAMKNVDMTGKWSIDVMITEPNAFCLTNEENDLYLIDMGIAERSAYWQGFKG
jgi:hypothetical protein